jgi:hypothetical protein
MKYHENPIEYKYINNLNQLQERLYYLYAQEKAGNNFHNEKMGVIKFIIEQLENNANNPKGTKYILRFINCLPKGLTKTGPNEYISDLYQFQQRFYYILAQEMGGNHNFYNEKMDIINFIGNN